MKRKTKRILIVLFFVFAIAIIIALLLEKSKGSLNLIRLENMLQNYASKKMLLKGDIIDEKGTPVNGVSVQIEKVKSDLLTMSDTREKESIIVDSKFSLQYTGWHDIIFSFSKDGYYPVKEVLSAIGEKTADTHNIKENTTIVLRETGTFAKHLQDGIMYLEQEKQYDGSIRRTGWVYNERECEKYNIYERVRNMPYDAPSEVDIYAEKTEDGDGLYLIANGENAGFTEPVSVPDFTYLPEAPESGYTSKLKIPFLTPNNDGGNKRKSVTEFSYFKLKEGIYGKMKIEAKELDDGEAYRITCSYYLNPDGSRNLRSKEKH